MDVIKQTELESQQLSLTADRQPLQTCYSISLAGSWSHFKQCSRMQNAHAHKQTDKTGTFLLKG